MTFPVLTFAEVQDLRAELVEPRNLAARAYIDRDEPMPLTLLGDLCLLIAVAKQHGSGTMLSLAEFRELESRSYITSWRPSVPLELTELGAEFAAEALHHRRLEDHPDDDGHSRDVAKAAFQGYDWT